MSLKGSAQVIDRHAIQGRQRSARVQLLAGQGDRRTGIRPDNAYMRRVKTRA